MFPSPQLISKSYLDTEFEKLNQKLDELLINVRKITDNVIIDDNEISFTKKININ